MEPLQWNSGNLLTLGWSDAEELLCVQDDGLVLIYNMFGQYLHAFSMGQEAKDTKIIDAKIFASNSGTGVAVMTTNFRIFLINSIKEPKNRLLPEMPSKCAAYLEMSVVSIVFSFSTFDIQNQYSIRRAGP